MRAKAEREKLLQRCGVKVTNKTMLMLEIMAQASLRKESEAFRSGLFWGFCTMGLVVFLVGCGDTVLVKKDCEVFYLSPTDLTVCVPHPSIPLRTLCHTWELNEDET